MRVIGELAGVRIENLDHAVRAFASAQGKRNDGANLAQAGPMGSLEAGIVDGSRER